MGKCLKCGKCCFLHVRILDVVYELPFPCPYLRNKKCSIYHKRWEVNPNCLTVQQGFKAGLIPKGCGYPAPSGYVPSQPIPLELLMRNWTAIIKELNIGEIEEKRMKKKIISLLGDAL